MSFGSEGPAGHFGSVESQSTAAASGITLITSTGATVTITNPAGPTVNLEVAPPGASTLAAAYAAGLAGTPAVDNAFLSSTLTSTGPQLRFKHARGLGPIANGDEIGTWSYQGVSAGTTFTQGLLVGGRVAMGPAVSAGVLPSDWFVYSGATADPFAAGTEHIGMRLFSNGVLGLNFPASMNNVGLELPDTTTHETALISGYGPGAQGGLSTLLAQFRDNAAGTPTYLGGLFWEYAGSLVAGLETTQFGIDVQADGNSVQGLRLIGYTGGTSQAAAPSGTVAHPGWACAPDYTTGFYGTVNALSGIDLNYSKSGVRFAGFLKATAAVAGNAQTSIGDFQFHVLGGAVAAGGEARVTVGPLANNNGLYYDHIQGGIYLFTLASSTAIGKPGYQATGTTEGYLALNTMQAVPTGAAPLYANVTTGKTLVTYYETGDSIYALNRASSTWHFVHLNDYTPTATRVPFGGATAGTTTDSASLFYTTATGILRTPLLETNTVGGFGGGNVLTLENNHAAPTITLQLNAADATLSGGPLLPSVTATQALGSPSKTFGTAWLRTIAGADATVTVGFATDEMRIQTNTTGVFTVAHSTNDRFVSDATGIAFFTGIPVAQQTGGAATAGLIYGATEQGMIQRMYDALQAYALIS